MCGIAGLLGVAPAYSRDAALRMRAALRHRGPDDEGLEVVSRAAHQAPAVLAHTRLSIVELSAAGHQPMCDRTSRGEPPNWITFNGEIYNFRDLRPELDLAGWPCHTGSDTEVILNGYRAWGPRAVERFEGMFAFCLVDVERGLAWLCRDRLGIKPLYLFRPRSGGLLFASEVRALLAAGAELVPRRLRAGALESFLAQGAVMDDEAIVEGVVSLPTGASLIVDFEGKELRSSRYWQVAFGSDAGAVKIAADGMGDGASEPVASAARYRSESVAEIRAALRRSIGQELLADVPVGLFLSSGIDSTALAVLARETSRRPLRTLGVGFDVSEFDESEGARTTARELGTDHRALTLAVEDVIGSFDDVLAAMDQPTVDGFNVFYVARAARQSGLKVALSGLGGDELFGGYATFTDVPRALRLDTATWRFASPGTREKFAQALGLASRVLGQTARARGLHKLAETVRRPPEVSQLYFLRRELFSPGERRSLHELPAGSDPWSGIALKTLQDLKAKPQSPEILDQIAALEVQTYMRYMLLRDADVFSMAHGLEVRVPLLGQGVVEQAARARSEWRRRDPRPKPLLIDAVGPGLSERVWRAKKRGFTFPWASWLRGALAPHVESALLSPALERAGLTRAGISTIHRRFASGDHTVSALQVLALVVLADQVTRHGLQA